MSEDFLSRLSKSPYAYTPVPSADEQVKMGMPTPGKPETKNRQSFNAPPWMQRALDNVIESKLVPQTNRSQLIELLVQQGLQELADSIGLHEISAQIRRHERIRADYARALERKEYPESARQARGLIHQLLEQKDRAAAREAGRRALRLLADAPRGLVQQVQHALMEWEVLPDLVEDPDTSELREAFVEFPDETDAVTALLVELAEEDPGEDPDWRAGWNTIRGTKK